MNYKGEGIKNGSLVWQKGFCVPCDLSVCYDIQICDIHSIYAAVFLVGSRLPSCVNMV